MKIVALLCVMTMLSACRREKSSIVPGTDEVLCDARQNYVKTETEAAQKLIGEWKLQAVDGYFVVRPGVTAPATPVVPDHSITFSKNGVCTITQNGRRSGSVAYQVGTIRNFVGIGLSYPSLTVADTMQNASTGIKIGGPVVLLVCDNKLILDYGTPVDAPAYTYQKVK